MLLIIDNYDSFTFNLVHYFEELGARTHVIRNDVMSAAGSAPPRRTPSSTPLNAPPSRR